MKKLLVLLLAVPCMVLADKADTLLYLKLDPTNNVRYEVHDSYGSIYLQMWKSDSIKMDSNVRHTREVLENDINLPDTVIHNASYEEIIWMVLNPRKDTLLAWVEYNRVLEGKPSWLPLYDLEFFTSGVKLIAQHDSSRFIVEPRDFREWTWNTSDKIRGTAYYCFLVILLLMSIRIFWMALNKVYQIFYGCMCIVFSIVVSMFLEIDLTGSVLLVVVSFLLSSLWKRKKADLAS